MISERTFVRSFGSFWHELLPLLTPRFVALFNEAYESVLRAESGQLLEILPVPADADRLDIVAEFAFRLARLQRIHAVVFDQIRSDESLLSKAESEALELIQRYEGGAPGEMIPLSRTERTEGLRLFERYGALSRVFSSEIAVEFCPTFPGAGFLNMSEGDIRIGDCLIEVKTTTKKPAGKDIRQLIVYAALDANARGRKLREFGIFNPRRGTLHRVEIAPLLLRLSGGKPSADVFADLIAFAESNEPAVERKF
jgi:hypothetical protein